MTVQKKIKSIFSKSVHPCYPRSIKYNLSFGIYNNKALYGTIPEICGFPPFPYSKVEKKMWFTKYFLILSFFGQVDTIHVIHL